MPLEAAPVVIKDSAANPADLTDGVDAFRALLGTNNGVGGSALDGRREINWDGTPDAFAEPNFLTPNFFNSNSPRGAVFATLDELDGAANNQFRVSAKADNPTGTAVRFGNINASYETIFQTFSAQRLFHVRDGNLLEVTFFIPGTAQPASSAGFGVVFADVDAAENAMLRCYGINGALLASAQADPWSNGLSFVGITFDTPEERCARIVIKTGNDALLSWLNDGGNVDLVAMDDFIYGEPRPLEEVFINGFQ